MDRGDRPPTRPAWRPSITLVGGVVVLLLLGAVLLYFTNTQAATTDQQPIAFPHQTMVQAGVDCVFCHTAAVRSPAAGIPSVEKCMSCHRTINPTAPLVQKAADYFNKQEPIPWVRVNRLPRFVYFSHQAHVIGGGLNCERCHGDVGRMTVDVQVVRMDMGWCLSCHEKQPNSPKIKECFVCHQ